MSLVKRRCLHVAMAMTAGLASAAHAAGDAGLRPLAGLQEEVVLSGMAIGDYRLELNRFTDPRPVALLLAEVRRTWSQRPAPIQSAARDGWTTLTQLAGDAVEVFEVRPARVGDGVEGRRSRWRKGDAGLADSGAWLERALPVGSRVIDRVGNRDGNRQVTTLVAVTPVTTEAASQVLASALARSGFSRDLRLAPSFHDAGLAQFFARGTEDLAVSISEHAGQRAIVMHHGRVVR
jgi:hypothetical protein